MSGILTGISSVYKPPAAGGIGTQTVTDDFNRANENPITGNWADSTFNNTNMTVASNHASPDAANADDADAWWTSFAGGNDHYSQGEVTVTGTSATAGMGVCVRHTSTANVKTMYRLVVDAGGNYDLGKFVAGSSSTLRTGTVSYVAGRKLGLSVSGSSTTTLKIWYNAVQVGTDVTDSSSPLTSGLPGIAFSSAVTAASLDNWDAGTVP